MRVSLASGGAGTKEKTAGWSFMGKRLEGKAIVILNGTLRPERHSWQVGSTVK
jgi:hypothetical protein